MQFSVYGSIFILLSIKEDLKNNGTENKYFGDWARKFQYQYNDYSPKSCSFKNKLCNIIKL